MVDKIKARVFLVGCPRSGTTLLQSMLYAHPEIYSFPETFFFDRLFGSGERRTLAKKTQGFVEGVRAFGRDSLRGMGFVEARRYTKAWAGMRVLSEESDIMAPVDSLRLEKHVEGFVRRIDEKTIEAGGRIWLEKTPDHLFCLNFIRKYVPQAKFIHIVRNGMDTVASLVDAAHKHPEVWGLYLSLDNAVRRWNVAVRESRLYRGEPEHYIINYEDLIENPSGELVKICGFLGCEFDEGMVNNFSTMARNLVLDSEKWKANNMAQSRIKRDSKFLELFDPSQRKYIAKHLEQWP